MHSAVMQNKKYIKFAEKNTVEVIAMGRLDQAVSKKDPKAGTYKDKDGVERMIEWPSLTYSEMRKLASSKAGTYNKTGKIPYTAVIDPYTLKETAKQLRSKGAIEDAVMEAKKAIQEKHGKGITRKLIKSVDAGIDKTTKLTADGQYAKALANHKKSSSKMQEWPEALQEKVKASRKAVIDAARARLDEVKAMDAKEAKREIGRLISKLKGTGFTAEAREFLVSLKEKK